MYFVSLCVRLEVGYILLMMLSSHIYRARLGLSGNVPFQSPSPDSFGQTFVLTRYALQEVSLGHLSAVSCRLFIARTIAYFLPNFHVQVG